MTPTYLSDAMIDFALTTGTIRSQDEGVVWARYAPVPMYDAPMAYLRVFSAPAAPPRGGKGKVRKHKGSKAAKRASRSRR